MTPDEAAGIQAIIRQMAEQYLVDQSAILGKALDRSSTRARQHAIALIRETYPQIPSLHLAPVFGMCDHTSINRALRVGNAILNGTRPVKRPGGSAYRKNRTRFSGVVIRPTEATKITQEEDLNTQLLALHSEKHLDDLDAGGYPDASSTELLIDPDPGQRQWPFVPISRQVLWSSRAQVAA